MKHYIYIKDKETNEVYKWTTTDRVVNNMDFYSAQIRRYKRLSAVCAIQDDYVINDKGYRADDGSFSLDKMEQREGYLEDIDKKEKNMIYIGTSAKTIPLSF